MNAETSNTGLGADWRDHIFRVFQDHDIKQVYHVPDAGHARLIEHCQRSNAIRTLALTTEEEGVALAAGAWLGGQRSALLMQSSGVGNTINMMGLTKTLRFPFLTLITMRGDYGEFNSWQYPMGQGTPKVLEAMGLLLYPVERAEDVRATVDAAARTAFNGGQAVAVLLRQKLIGIKDFGKKTAK
ncbi:MAG: phosphonopyruvate decarboxylase [Alphaproteobacteria bacterium]|nr:phosphonopyruvate decarboxylase [Alphaproteobacteria bacterium]